MNKESVHFDERLRGLIAAALAEDTGDGDHSTLSCIRAEARGRAVLKIKQDGILAGVDVARKIFHYREPSAVFRPHKEDGETMQSGETAFEVEASVHTILLCERLVLNCMQRMSGIATLTRAYVEKIRDYPSKILDTRKTTPNFRLLEKEAVAIGGGYNHRFGLFDRILVKDNHIDYCGGIGIALDRAYEYVRNVKPGLQIEVETRSLDDVKEVLKNGRANRILLDNFSPQQITEALALIHHHTETESTTGIPQQPETGSISGIHHQPETQSSAARHQIETEASGGIHLDNIRDYAATGVDFISIGALIHQAQSVDLSLKAIGAGGWWTGGNG